MSPKRDYASKRVFKTSQHTLGWTNFRARFLRNQRGRAHNRKTAVFFFVLGRSRGVFFCSFFFFVLSPGISGSLRRIWLGCGFIVVCFLYKINPNPPKFICCGEKSGPNATFDLIFHRVGLALGWGVRRFHNNILYMFSNPTEIGKSHTP